MTIEFQPIGIIRTPFGNLEGMPIQPAGAKGVRGSVDIFDQFHEGLQDLEGFSHVILLYHFHCSKDCNLTVIPYMDTKPHGLFATRAPKRPNPIGLSIVQLESIDDGVLHILGADMLDGTPLLDIKPYVPGFDAPSDVKTGWLEDTGKTVIKKRSDDRFV
jgi:tRNA (adenine37-N6)-methyltransferase